jgi:predicted TPR repeat methyltransferase
MQYPAYDPDGNIVRNATYNVEAVKRRYNAWHTYEEEALALGCISHEKIVEVMNALPDIDQRTDKADIGCGTGLVAKAWRRQDMVGYDVSIGQVEIARASGRYARVSELDINEHPLPKKYDLITACDLFNLELATADCLPNVASSLKEGGLLIMTMPQHTGYHDESGWQSQTSFELVSETDEYVYCRGENSGSNKYHKVITWRKL